MQWVGRSLSPAPELLPHPLPFLPSPPPQGGSQSGQEQFIAAALCAHVLPAQRMSILQPPPGGRAGGEDRWGSCDNL